MLQHARVKFVTDGRYFQIRILTKVRDFRKSTLNQMRPVKIQISFTIGSLFATSVIIMLRLIIADHRLNVDDAEKNVVVVYCLW